MRPVEAMPKSHVIISITLSIACIYELNSLFDIDRLISENMKGSVYALYAFGPILGAGLIQARQFVVPTILSIAMIVAPIWLLHRKSEEDKLYQARTAYEAVVEPYWRQMSGDEMYVLAMHHAHEEYNEKTEDELALKWFTRAAQRGHVGAVHMIGRYYDEENGSIAGKSRDTARVIYQKAALCGHKDAMSALDIMASQDVHIFNKSEKLVDVYVWRKIGFEMGRDYNKPDWLFSSVTPNGIACKYSGIQAWCDGYNDALNFHNAASNALPSAAGRRLQLAVVDANNFVDDFSLREIQEAWRSIPGNMKSDATRRENEIKAAIASNSGRCSGDLITPLISNKD